MTVSQAKPTKISIRSTQKFLNEISKIEITGTICYRGESVYGRKLCPSVMRDDIKNDAEHKMLRDLFNEVPDEFMSDKTMLDKLVRAQHYELPTRLLDVTLNPLVGLYFACSNTERHHEDGVVYCFDINEQRVKDSNSDTVSILCNIALLTQDEQNAIHNKTKSGESFANEERKIPDKLYKEKEMTRLLHFIKQEKSYFLPNIKVTDLFSYFFVHPKRNNNRVIAQSGAFLVAGLLRYKQLEKSKKIKLYEFCIPKKAKANILIELDRLNINEKSLFPEITVASKYIKRKYKAT